MVHWAAGESASLVLPRFDLCRPHNTIRPVVDEHGVVAGADEIVVEVLHLDPEHLDESGNAPRPFHWGDLVPRHPDHLPFVQLMRPDPTMPALRPNGMARRDPNHLPAPAEF